jgi:hypothetical protein
MVCDRVPATVRTRKLLDVAGRESLKVLSLSIKSRDKSLNFRLETCFAHQISLVHIDMNGHDIGR